MSEDVRAALVDAKAKLLAGGALYKKGVSTVLQGCICAGIAIDEACGKSMDLFRLTSDVFMEVNSIPVNENRSYSGIVDWNDAPERTFEEVLAAFDRAIESV